MLHHLKWKPHHWKDYSKSSKCCLPSIFVQCSYMINDHSMTLRKCTLKWQDWKGACKCWLFSYPTWAGYLPNLTYWPTSMKTGLKYQQEISSSSYSTTDQFPIKCSYPRSKFIFFLYSLSPTSLLENSTLHNKHSWIAHKWQCRPPLAPNSLGYKGLVSVILCKFNHAVIRHALFKPMSTRNGMSLCCKEKAN